ncbi:MAG: Na+/H+ antiporter NhaA [Planctomycetota bacterium]
MSDQDPRPLDSMGVPREPIDRIVKPITRFLHVEAAGGFVLLGCTVIALALANSAWSEQYLAIWKMRVGFSIGSFEMFHSLKHWINDGLMALFFFVVGLEVKRELVLGELREMRRAALPIAAALGGMIVPAAVYLLFLGDNDGAPGWGIPMATDIAFVVGCMAVLGSRVPHILRVTILSLAIADDIGAILVIAVGYTDEVGVGALLFGFAGIGVCSLLARLGVRRTGVYVVVGILTWLGFHESGVHATIAGVLLGLLTPARPWANRGAVGASLQQASEFFQGDRFDSAQHKAAKVRRLEQAARETLSPLERLESLLHPWSSFVVMPIFALSNAAVPFEFSDLGSPVAIAIIGGLVIGKPVGILGLSWLATKVGVASLPEGLTWKSLLGGGVLAGIGFTMALFISGLALDGPELDAAKVGVLAGSAIAAVIGMVFLTMVLPKPTETPTE